MQAPLVRLDALELFLERSGRDPAATYFWVCDFAIDQNKLLKDGDVVTTTIDGLGTITNKCVRASDHARADFLPEQMKPLLADK